MLALGSYHSAPTPFTIGVWDFPISRHFYPHVLHAGPRGHLLVRFRSQWAGERVLVEFSVTEPYKGCPLRQKLGKSRESAFNAMTQS